MASPYSFPVRSLERETHTVKMIVSIGAVGAPTVDRGKGVSTVVRNGAGDYTITMLQKWALVMGLRVTLVDNTARDFTFQAANDAMAASKTIDLLALTGGVATELPSGSKLLVEMDLRNASGR